MEFQDGFLDWINETDVKCIAQRHSTGLSAALQIAP